MWHRIIKADSALVSRAQEERPAIRAGNVPPALTFREQGRRAAVVPGNSGESKKRGTYLVRTLAYSQSHEAGSLFKNKTRFVPFTIPRALHAEKKQSHQSPGGSWPPLGPRPPHAASSELPSAAEGRADRAPTPRPAPAEPGGRRLTTPPPECSDLRPPHLLQQARHGSADGRARAALWEAPSGSLNPPPRPPLRHLGNSVAPPSQDLQGPACSQREN